MSFEQLEFKFPDEGSEEAVEIEVEDDAEEVKAEAEEASTEKETEVKEEPKQEIEIEVVDDTPEADRGRKPSNPPEDVTDEELDEYSSKVRNRIKHFSKSYHDERREKERALRERQELEQYTKQLLEENSTLKNTVSKNQGVLLAQAKRSVLGELASAKSVYKEAYESGDADAVLAAQQKLTAATIKADKVSNYKLPPLQQETTEVQTTEQQVEPPPQDPKLTKWTSENTWFGSDDEMTVFALGVHNKLVKEGVDPQSENYYVRINSRMREVFPTYFGEEPVVQTTSKASTVVAPASRSTAPKKVKLSKSQIAIAKRLGVPLQVYAEQQAALMRTTNG